MTAGELFEAFKAGWVASQQYVDPDDDQLRREFAVWLSIRYPPEPHARSTK